jgi:hypothetical protein
MRWHYRDAALLWLFPPAYLLHLAEELWGGPGLLQWFAAIAGRPLPRLAFAIINAAGFALLVTGIRMAVRREAAGWIAIAIATVATMNALLHVAGSVMTGQYSPGLITGVVLYLPLGQLLLSRAWSQVEQSRFTHGVVAGVAIHIVVIVAAAASAAWGQR